jgi:hypothetical protein
MTEARTMPMATLRSFGQGTWHAPGPLACVACGSNAMPRARRVIRTALVAVDMLATT